MKKETDKYPEPIPTILKMNKAAEERRSSYEYLFGLEKRRIHKITVDDNESCPFFYLFDDPRYCEFETVPFSKGCTLMNIIHNGCSENGECVGLTPECPLAQRGIIKVVTKKIKPRKDTDL